MTTPQIAIHLAALDEIAGEHGGNRASGTTGYDASADYVAEQLAAMGYDVSRQAVDFTFFRESSPVVLNVGDETWTGTEWLHAMVYSAGGDVSGVIESVGIERGLPTDTAGCDVADWEDFGAGGIAIVFGGACLRRDVVGLAQDADAAAVITMYTAWGANEIRQPTLLDPAGISIPAVAVGEEPALALLAAAETGAEAQLSVEVEMSPATADNVLAELPGDDDGVVMVGGHLDSVLDGPGINDNGSGVAALLAIAAALRGQPQEEQTVRFALWAAEEFGVLGSTYYVDSLTSNERDSIDAYINLDMVGSINAGLYVYDDDFAAPGSAQISRMIRDALDDLGSPSIGIPSGGSDHIPFAQAGIPTAGVFSGVAPLSEEHAALFGRQANVSADPCYHLACDGLMNVDTQTARLFGQAIATVVQALAR